MKAGDLVKHRHPPTRDSDKIYLVRNVTDDGIWVRLVRGDGWNVMEASADFEVVSESR